MNTPFVHDWFAATAAAQPDATAIEVGAERLSYAELERRANGLARAMAEALAPGTLVGLLSDDLPQVVTGMLAALKAGCAFVPLDPWSGDARLALLIDEVDLRCWLADQELLPRLALLSRRSRRPFRVLCAGADPGARGEQALELIVPDGADAAPFNLARDPDSLCYVFFTSGSTGRPKGIAGRLKAIDHFVRWEARSVGARAGLRFSQLTSPAFDAVLRDVFTPLCTGGVVCVPAERDTRRHAFGLLAWLRASRVNVMHCVPSVLRTLLQVPLEECGLPDLECVLTSGEPLLPTDVKRWLPRFGARARLLNLYGPSETTMIKLAHPVSASDAERRSVPIGKPIDGARAIVLNEHGKVCPPGVDGEIYIRTPYRSLGYYGRPELTAEVFVPNPYSDDPQDLVYRTGDLGRVLEDGSFEFLGRRDGQVKVRGVRVELAEVENALRHDPRVTDAAVIDRALDDGSRTLCAFVVLSADLTVEALREGAAELLPEALLPSVFVPLAALPRTVTGKVERTALEALVPASATAAARPEGRRTPIEELVATAWAEVFGRERVGLHDDFFQHLGGHSLLATQVLARLQPLFEVPLKLRWMFEHPTVAGLSACIERELGAVGEGEAGEPPLERVSRTQALPASFGQERLWVVDQVTGTRAYHLTAALRLRGALSAPALDAAVTALSERHESLRTRFGVVDGRPVQQITAPAAVTLPWVDLEPLPAERRAQARRRVLSALERAPFDLSRGPLWRLAVVRLAPEDHALGGVLHHIVGDDWSLGVLMRDLVELYEASRAGRPSSLPALALQYADYAVWQRRALSGAVVAREVAYWRAQLAGLAALELPTDRPRPALPSGRGRVAWRRWGAELSARVPAWAAAHGATPFMLLLAGWQALLARYAGQADVSVGVPVAQRPRPELEPLIGLFLNTLVLRARLGRETSWLELVGQTRAATLGALAHQALPFERLLDEIQPERNLSRTPLFQVLFVLHDLPTFAQVLPGLSVETLESASTGAKFDLELGVRSEADGLTWRLEYAADLFDAATAERLLAHLERLVEAALAEPRRPLAELPLLSAAERAQALTHWNATARAWPDAERASLPAWLAAQAARTPQAPALRWEDGTWTYAELHDRADRLARRLRRLGVGPESRVAVWIERSPLMVVGVLAVLKAGGAYVPLDPDYPAARLAYQVADSRASVVLTTSAWRQALPAGDFAVEVLDAPDAAWRGEEALADAPPVHPDQLAYIIYTSGSTGQPKGAMNTHRGVLNRLWWMQATYDLGRQDRVLQKTSSSFDVSVWELFWPLGTGALLVLARAGGQNDPGYLADLIGRAGVSVAHFVPTMLEAFVSAGGLAACAGVRLIVASGEGLPGALAARCAAAWPGRLENLYGPTEAAVDVTWQPCTPDTWSAPLVPIGRPVANTQVYVRDPAGEPVPVGAVGEVFLGGVQVGRGYWDRPALTAERFVPDPFGPSPGARLYRTGDLARYRPDGVVEYLGRADHQVKLHGNRIELGEIEAVLRRQPGIRDAAVALREDRPGVPRLVAYLVSAGAAPAVDTLRQALRAHLPDYMVPAVVMTLEALPLTPNGKLDRGALPAPSEERPLLAQGYAPPRTPVEATLASVWADVLRLERVGIHDNFFALGGDSILGLQALARAREAGVHLVPRQLFQHQTIADLALVATRAESRVSLDEGPDEADGDDVPLTPIQHWFFERAADWPGHFNQSVLLAGGPELPTPGWEAVLDALGAQHDALRLRFSREDGEWRQRSTANASRHVCTHVDLTGAGARWTEQLEQVAARVQRSLDLEQGPLLRLVRFQVPAPEPQRLFIVVHHAVVDGLSWRVLLEDLYRASALWQQGRPIQLPGRTASFRRWARHLQARAASLGADVGEYWRAIDDRARAVVLPRDAQDGPNSAASLRHVSVSLDPAETLAFLQAPPRAYRMQAHEVLIAAAAQALAGWTGGAEAVLALEGHGRESSEDDGLDLERTLGCFTTVYPVRVQLPQGGAAAVLSAVKEQLRAVPRRGLDYGLWRYGPGRAERAWALPEVLVNYLGQFDQVLEQGGARLASERMGRMQHPGARRAFVLELNGGVAHDRLSVSIGYSAHLHRPESIAAFADAFLARLRELIAHCREVPFTRTTPSDVPLAPVTQAELDAFGAQGGEIESVYPLSPMQAGLLFHALFDPDASLYFQQVRVTLEGELDVEAFRRAWADVMARHAILRTAFAWEARERLLQVAYARAPLECQVHDLQALPPEERAARLAEQVDADRTRGFRLDRVPIMRVALFRLEPRRWEVVWSYHHILLDGWCVPLVFAEVTLLYEAHRTGQAVALAPVARFGDYISWLQAQDAAQAEAYWRRRLAGFRAPTAFLPARESGDGALADEGYGRRERALASETVARLHELARREQVTLNTLVQGAWAVLLSRYARTRDVVFGATSSGRPAELPGIEAMVGLFINTLPVRVDVDPAAPALPWMRALQAAQAEGRQYEYTPLVDIQGWSELPGGVPLFDSLLAFENYPVNDELVRGQASFRIAASRVFEKTNYPVTLQVSPAAGLLMRILFDARRVDGDAVERLLAHADSILSALARDPQVRLGDLPLLSEQERAQVVSGWNTPAREAAALRAATPATLLERLERQAVETPEAPALVAEGGRLTYAELHGRANRLAHVLRAEGIGPEVPVLVCVPRSLELVVALLGVWKAGGAYVPVDPQAPAARLAYLAEDARAPVQVTTRALRELLPPAPRGTILLDDDAGRLAAAPAHAPTAGVTADNLAYVIYTSGSTGRPKGVGVTHGNVSSLFQATEPLFGFGPQDTWTLFHSAAFDFSVWEMWGALAYGGRLVVVPAGMPRTPEAFGALLRQERVTVLNQTPSAFRALQSTDTSDLSLRVVIFGGEALAFESLRPWIARHGLERPQLVNMYGITETTVHVTHHLLTEADLAPGAGSRVGRALASLQLYVLDPAGQPAPVGVAGELFVGGAGVARGYLGRPDLTATRFVPDPFGGAAGARLYRTGDLARWRADGRCEYLGRTDHQVKLRGYRIELGEIEAVLREQAGIRDALVQLREDVPGDRRLVGYVVADAAAGPEGGDALPREWERGQVAQWQSVFERTYAPGPGPADPTFNVVGWNSSLSGAPIPEHEMREWVDETVADVAALAPRSVLEIGCGTGLLLLRLAPGCERYRGTDISRTALDSIERQLGPLGLAPRVSLLHAAADELDGLGDERFHAVVINSVAQYFPGADYLERVLEGALARVLPGGTVYVGDVRSLALLRAFHLSVQFQQAPDWLAREALERRVERQVLQEEELLLAPEFFLALARRLPAVSHVEIRPKLGRALNEMSKYRYQALLRVQAPDGASAEPAWCEWSRDGLTLEALKQRLRHEAPEALGLRGVPNARLQADLALAEALAAADPGAVVDELRVQLAARAPGEAGLHPADLLALARELSYEAAFDWTRHDAEGAFDVVLTRRGAPAWRGLSRAVLPPASGARLANSPSLGQAGRRLALGLRQALEQRLPSYMVPAAFVVLERLPLTSNGKLDRQALPPPDFARPELEQAYVAPRTPLESELAQAWSEVLRVQQVGIHDNFFELGGDSIISIQLVARAGQAGLALTPRLLFEQPTIAQLAAAIQAGRDAPAAEPSRAEGGTSSALAGLSLADLQRGLRSAGTVEDAYPLSSMQEGMLFHTVAAPESGVYVAQLTYGLHGALDPAALRRAWQHALDRHPALRTGFLWDQAALPLQVVCAGAQLPWEEHDWRALPEAEREARLDALLERDRARGFDLAAPPLMRVTLVRTGDDRWEVVWSHHHLVLDGWSLPIVTGEVVASYAAFQHGSQPRLDAPVPYGGYIAWLREQDLGEAEAFWRRTLRGVTRATPLPLRPAETAHDGPGAHQQQLRVRASARQTAALKAWARARRVTLNTLLQAVWALLVRRLSGETDVLFGGVVSGRPPSLPGSERAVGLFINTLPVRVQVPDEGDLGEWLAALQAQQAAQRQYEYVPLVRIKTWSEVPPEAPLFETLLVFENFPRESVSGSEVPGLRLEGVRYHMVESHALVLAAGPGAELALELKYDRRRVEPSAAQRVRAMLEGALELLAGGGAARVADLARAMERAEHEQRHEDQVLTETTAAELLRAAKRSAARRRPGSEVDDGSGTPAPRA
jgi:amino acid adenylation domain-containing protein/non-ribosomal peptide synthase protein (TIGR01720 family)